MSATQIELPVTKEMELRQPTPMAMIQQAITQGAGIEILERLMDLQIRWEQHEARKAFENAMADFKAETIVIPKDKENKQYGSRYTSIEKMVEVVTPFLSRHRLVATWSVDQTSGIKITCTLEAFGHSKSCSVIFPPDISGKKNSLQEIKSAITYGKISTYEAVCGLASEAGNLSDDGNAAGSKGMTGDEAERLQEWIDSINSSADLQELDHHFREAFKVQDKQAAKDALISAKDKMRGELRKRGAR